MKKGKTNSRFGSFSVITIQVICLKELRSRAAQGHQTNKLSHGGLVFRNYQPYDQQLTHSVPKIPDNNVESIESKNAILYELSNAVGSESDLTPKKINWDLKLQTTDRMEKLRRRTQRSVVELLREKLVNEAIAEN